MSDTEKISFKAPGIRINQYLFEAIALLPLIGLTVVGKAWVSANSLSQSPTFGTRANFLHAEFI